MEEVLYDYLQSLEEENYHLKRQLSGRNKAIRQYKRLLSKKNAELKDKKKKQHYKNGKRGTCKNG